MVSNVTVEVKYEGCETTSSKIKNMQRCLSV